MGDDANDKLLAEISDSLLRILSLSPRPEVRQRCLDGLGARTGAEFEETIERRLRSIFRLRPRESQELAAASQVGAAPAARPGRPVQQRGAATNGAQEEEEMWSSGSSDDFDVTEEDDFEETDKDFESESDAPEVAVGGALPTLLLQQPLPVGRAAAGGDAAAAAASGWTPPPAAPRSRLRAQTPPTLARPRADPSSAAAGCSIGRITRSRSRSRDEFDSSSAGSSPVPAKMARVEVSSTAVGGGDWSSGNEFIVMERRREMGRDDLPAGPSHDEPYARPGSPLPPRQILGELPLEKDEFDSDSDEEVMVWRPQQQHATVHLHTTSNTNTRNQTTTVPPPATVTHPPFESLPATQDENATPARSTVGETPPPSSASSVFTQFSIGASPLATVPNLEERILRSRPFPPPPATVNYSPEDDPDFDSD